MQLAIRHPTMKPVSRKLVVLELEVRKRAASRGARRRVESTVSNGASLFEYQQTVGVISGDGIEVLPSNDTLVTQYSDFGELVLGSHDSSIDNSVGGSTSSSSDASSSSSGGGVWAQIMDLQLSIDSSRSVVLETSG